MTQLLIGRRSVTLENFVNTVKSSKRYTEVCDKLGFNSTVSTTKQAIKEKIEELQLDITHFDYKYTKSEAHEESTKNRVKQFVLSFENQIYYDSFESNMKSASFPTYKATCGNFLEQLGNKDFAIIDITDITEYTAGKKNAEAHLRSLMIYIVKNKIGGAVEKVSKDMLIWLI